MADQRVTDYAGQVTTEFLDSFDLTPVPQSPLRRLAKQLESLDGANSFREYILPYIAPTETTLEAFRSQTSANPLTSNATTGGQIASTAMPNKYLDHVVETVFPFAFDVEATSGIDAKHNSPEKVAARQRKVFDQTRSQYEHIQCMKQTYYANEWVGADSANGVLEAAVSAAATTFDITDALAASTGIEVGDLVKIGDSRIPDATGGAAEVIDVVLVKSLASAGGTTTVTIETDKANFPLASNYLSSEFFGGLKTSISAHALGARIQVDRPITASVSTIDKIVTDIQRKADNLGIGAEGLVVYLPADLWYLLISTDGSLNSAPSVANDILGADILMKGTVKQYRGMTFITDNNALRRTSGGTGVTLASERQYIYAFKPGETFGYGALLQSSSMDKLEGTAGMLHKFSYAEISGSVLSYRGSQNGFLVSCVLG